MPPQQSGQNGQYDFFLNPPPAPKRSLFTGTSLRSRIILVSAMVVVVFMLIAIILSMVTSGSDNTPRYVKVVQDQNEIARVAAAGIVDADANSTQNFATTAQLSALSAQQQLLAYMASQHVKVGTKQLNATRNAQTDQELATAKAASSYDQTFKTIMQNLLNSYGVDLQAAFSHTQNAQARAILSQEYSSEQLLVKQLGSS